MEEKKNSPFYTALTEALDKAASLRSDNDSVLCLVSDGQTCSRVIGGDEEVLKDMLISYMWRVPQMARLICDAAHEFTDDLISAADKSLVRVVPPPVPEGGIGQWPDGSPVILQRSAEEARENNVSPNNDKRQ